MAVGCVDQSRIELLLEVALNPGALGGEVGHICRALQHRSRPQVKIHPRLEEQGAAHERALRDDDRSSAARCQMIDRRLDGLGVDGCAIRQRAEFRNQGIRRRIRIGHQCRPPGRPPEGSCKNHRHEPPACKRMNGHNSPLCGRSRRPGKGFVDGVEPVSRQQIAPSSAIARHLDFTIIWCEHKRQRLRIHAGVGLGKGSVPGDK